MSMRRLTRLTNAFSKKWDNLWAAYCLHFASYNFCRIHKTLRVTPAMETGITNRVWTLADLLPRPSLHQQCAHPFRGFLLRGGPSSV
jgi:hypothetical protein